jgi:hypothetical protein
MRARFGCLITSIVLLMSSVAPLQAGTTGKIAGEVRDDAGAPLPGAAVTIRGTRLGASTDVDGNYLILQVPPGQVVVESQLIGFRTVTVTDVRVSADRTTKLDFDLSEEAIEMDALMVTATRPPIEMDVTSSQITVDARRVADAPVATMLDLLSYEPGVSVARGNELEIRGGGPSEIRFAVDGIDRTDGLTGKAFTQLNQVLVAEVTVLTGGFNAEYGNVRSGMVNVVVKDGTESGTDLPWISGAATYAPAQRKHFGPGLYDVDQYDYWLLSSKSPIADSAMNSALYWPLLYEETRDDPAFYDPTHELYRDPRTTQFLVFGGRSGGNQLGWQHKADLANAENRGAGAYGYNQWTPEQVREAWEWESNMNETSWRYAHEPDYNLDLATGWALPQKAGGLIVGYRRSREMTVGPALRPYFDDESIEAKLTLTPTDNLKLRITTMTGSSVSTGAASSNSSRYNPELAASGAGSVIGADPISLRSASDLISSLQGTMSDYNKLNLSNNGYLDGGYSQYGASATYTFGANTFVNASIGRSSSTWDLTRELPRADVDDYVSRYRPPTEFGYGAMLSSNFDWSDIDGDGIPDYPTSIEDATTPGRAIYRTPFRVPNKYDEVPSETIWVTQDFVFDGETVKIISPQGWLLGGYPDLSRTYSLGGGGDDTYDGTAEQWVLKSDLTHAAGNHTFKTGLEYITGDLEYHIISSRGLTSYSDFRDYGGEWPAARPNLFGFFVQDKMETDGMIANAGVRVDRFDAGHPALIYDDIFNGTVVAEHGRSIFTEVVIAAGWDTTAWGAVPTASSGWRAIDDSLKTIGSAAPVSGDVVAAAPHADNAAYWRFAPRFGISHPISQRSKLFFNYGIFYSMQKPSLMYGHYDHDGRLGGPGNIREVYNPNLRPAKTTMYEVGVEHVLPFSVVAQLRAYAKYNIDQASTVSVSVGTQDYRIYRNSNYEDIRGAEVKLSRSAGRFLNGWFSYERSASRTGEVGLKSLNRSLSNVQRFEAFARSSKPQGSFRAMLRVSTPRDLGAIRGGWSLSAVQSYRSGGELEYNPDPEVFTTRDLTDEHYLPIVDYWNTDLKLSKSIQIEGRRSVSVYMDVTNLWDTRRLNAGSGDYTKYIYYERLKGRDIKYGQDTHIFTRPYRDQDSYWQPPLSPRSDWSLYLYPRYYRFGARFEL